MMNTAKKEKPSPLPPFKSVEEAIMLLQSFNFINDNGTTPAPDKTGIIESSGRGNIFRAFKNVPKPSDIYRGWAHQNYSEIQDQLKHVQDQQQFDKLIFDFSDALIDSWNDRCGAPNLRIGFGPATKLINLLIKSIQQHPNERIEGLDKFMHVPFDLYTLLPLRKIINELTDVKYKVPIPNNPTMQFVVNKELYQLLQEAIRKIALGAGKTPIEFDYLCWNNQHL